MKRIALYLLLALLLPLGTAAAEGESPQHFGLEIKFSPYVPALDQTKGLGQGQTPFSDLFGATTDPKGAAPSRGLLTLLEFDYQFFHRFGVLAVGIGGGYYRKTAPAFAKQGTPPNDAYCAVGADRSGGVGREYTLPDAKTGRSVVQNPPDSCFSGDENQLNIVPLSLLAIYRFDVLDKRFRIPIIPYIKLGLGYYVWWFGSSGSFTSQVNSIDAGGNQATVNANGSTVGFVLHPGIAIDLSTIDPASARAIDQEIGLNRVSAFIEMNGAWISGCGCTNAMKLNLSDLSFSAGLSFEF
jgi:hypothetical protein